MFKAMFKKHVTFQLPEGYEPEESPLPSTFHLRTTFPATTAQHNAPVERTSPPRAAKPIAAQTSHEHEVPRPAVVPSLTPAVVPSVTPASTAPSRFFLLRERRGQVEVVVPPLPASTPHPAMNLLLTPRDRRDGLTYNMLYDSTVASAGGVLLTTYQREQPATNPPVRRMVIMPVWSRSRAPPAGFPKRLIAVESPVSRASPVALVDVLDAVQEWLHQPVEQDAWSRSSQEEQRIAATAFWERVRRAGPPFEQECVRVRGVRRIDYLGDRTYFGGLRPLPDEPEIWTLDLTPATATR